MEDTCCCYHYELCPPSQSVSLPTCPLPGPSPLLASVGQQVSVSAQPRMTNTPHLLLLLLPLLLILSPLLAVSGRSQLAKDPATFPKVVDSSDYTNEEYEEVRERRELSEMEEMEQNLETKLESKYSPSKHRIERRQVGERDPTEETSGDTEPILVEDPQGWGLAHILG